MTATLGLLGVAALIAANGYFVAAEFAYVAVRRARLDEAAAAGDRRAPAALAIGRRLSFMLSGAQLGITATSLGVGFVAEATIGRALLPLVELVGAPAGAAPGIAFTAGFLLATGVQMVVGELAPKNLAIARPEQLALSLGRVTWLFLRAAGPLIWLFDASANRLLRVLGIEPIQEVAGSVSAEELGVIIEESGRTGALTPTQTALLHRILEFRRLRAADAMVSRPRVTWVAADASCEELRRIAVESGHSRLLVCGEGLDDVVGVVQATALFDIDADARAHTPVRALVQPVLAVPESMLLGPLLAELRAAHAPLAVVVDEHGGTAGIVTIEDIVEELVGEIRDEYDVAEPGVQQLRDGSYLVPGSWRIDEVVRDTGLELPTGDYETVSGLVMERLGRLPRAGDSVVVETAVVRVMAMREHAVARVRLVPARASRPGLRAGTEPSNGEEPA